MRRHAILTSAIGAATACILVASSGVQAAESGEAAADRVDRPAAAPRVTESSPEPKPSELESIMTSENVSEKEASSILDDMIRFSEIVAKLRARHPDTFVNSRVARQPFSLHVMFTETPDLSDTDLSAFQHPVRIEESDAPTEAELEKIRSSIFRRLDETQRTLGTMTELDSGAGIVRVVLPRDFNTEGDPGLARLLDDPRVQLEQAGAGARLGQEIVRGGGKLLLPNDNFECTTGFAVVSNIGVSGISSAGHCENATKYVRPSDGGITYLLHQWSAEGILGDFAWFTSPDNEPAEFYAHNGTIRDTKSVRPAGGFSQDDQVWFYGRASGGGTAYVRSTNTSCDHVDSLVMMKTHPSLPRDSGGPWYVGTQANGIHPGGCELPSGEVKSVFSKAAKMEQLSHASFQVTIKLKP